MARADTPNASLLCSRCLPAVQWMPSCYAAHAFLEARERLPNMQIQLICSTNSVNLLSKFS